MTRTAILASLLASLSLQAWCGIPESEYQARRARLLGQIDTTSACAFRAIDARMRSNDVEYRYRQESSILYLTGLSEPGFVLLASPRGIRVEGKTATLVLLCQPSLAGTLRAAGAFSDGLIGDLEKFPEVFEALTGLISTLFVSAPDLRFTNDWLNNRPMFLDAESRKLLQGSHPGLKIKSAAPFVGRLRQYKSTAELDLIRKAIRVTGDGIRHAIEICKPGAFEYELQAAVEYEMIRQGADYESYPSIIGSGPNSTILHYDENRREIHKGDVIVMDVGAEYDGYAADITRTIPASGEFTPEQKKVYMAVLKAQEEVIKLVHSGTLWSAIEAKAQEVLTAEGFGKHMPHGVSHHLGLDVHDAGAMDTLRAGMVITVEPGVYIPEGDSAFAPAYRGMGIRIEDDVLVGEHGPTVLSSAIPKDLATLEKLARAARRKSDN